jgi:hypothetical protein
MNEMIAVLVIAFAVVVVLFLVFREVVCWYWKINETLSVLKDIREILQKTTPADKGSSTLKVNSSASTAGETEDSLYSKVKAQDNANNYDEAVGLCRLMLEQFPDGSHAEWAHIYLGAYRTRPDGSLR